MARALHISLCLGLGAFLAASPLAAQTPPPQAPAAENPAAATPPPQSPPPATAPPAATTPAPATPPAPPAPGAAASPPPEGGQLPEVEVVQEPPAPRRAPAPRAARRRAPPPVVVEAPSPAAEPAPATAPTDAFAGPTLTTSVRISPTAGSEVPIEKIPGSVSVVNSQDLKRAESASITKALEQRVPGVTITDALGNGLSNDLNFRGFSASPLNGTPQGLAIYQNGVRINEVFGDAVYWDNIPAIAISDIVVMSNNPAFGLNALGGSVNVIMKDGFLFQGVGIETKFGSFGHETIAVEAGTQYNNQWAAYAAGEYINDDGWRDLSPAEAKRFFGDLAAKGTNSEFHLSYTYNDSSLGVVGPTPVDLINERRENVFTSPQAFFNTMNLVSLTGAVDATDTLKITGNTYYRSFKQKRPDGNVSEAIPCDPAEVPPDPVAGEFLCLEEDDDPLFDSNGNMVPVSVLNGGIPGGNDSVSVDSYAFGGTLQGVTKMSILNRPNQFMLGASIDRGRANSKSSSELGILDPVTFVVTGTGIIIDQGAAPPGTFDEGDIEVTPVDLDVSTTYYGLYFSNTLDVTDALSLTFGGRYNAARIKLEDNLGDDLNGDHRFYRFNPMAGLTYKFGEGLSVYGGYSEANRAPTPAELACADPERPCILENFLVSDPPLNQVVARTVEAGVRGAFNTGFASDSARINWSLGYFRTETEDDIFTVASPIQGRGYFLNAGGILREGLEAQVDYRSDRLFMYAGYAFVDATFQDAIELASPDNPLSTPCSDFVPDDPQDEAPGCVAIQPGDQLPVSPRHRFKLGFDYFVTKEWKVGADLVATSSQFFRGDEGNDDTPLSGYTVINMRTSYQVTPQVQLFGLVNNVFDQEYETFGTYFDTEALEGIDVGQNGIELENPRTVTPAQPRAFYGGMKVRF